MPRVTAVVPCHNGERFIRAAIDSVLAQTFRDLEVVVADDGSSDRSPEIVASYGPPVRLIRVRHGNTQATRNAAIAASDSELVGLLDQDDAWWPGKLVRQIDCLAADPRLGLCYTDTRTMDPEGRELPGRHNRLQVPRDWTDGLGRLLGGNIMAASTVLLRRGAIERAGPFDPTFHRAGDWDLWLRIAQIHPVAALPQVLVDYGWHGGNLSRARIAMLEEAIGVQTRALERIARDPRWGDDPGLMPYRRAARGRLAVRCSELGWSLARAGRRAEAMPWHHRSLGLRPFLPRTWSRWARTLLGVGRPPARAEPR